MILIEALDNNDIEDFPVGILKLSTLKHLWLRYATLKEIMTIDSIMLQKQQAK